MSRGSSTRFLERLQQDRQAKKERYQQFLKNLPPERLPSGPTNCPGQEKCSGYIWQWQGELELNDTSARFVEVVCSCRYDQKTACNTSFIPGETDRASTCTICKGIGYLRHQASVGDQDFGKLVLCQCQSKTGQTEAKLLEASRLPQDGRLGKITLEGFAATANGSQAWYKKFLGWIDKWPNDGRGIILGGEAGLGKTGLAVAGAKHLIAKHQISVFYIKTADFVSEMSECWKRKDGSEKQKLLEPMINAKLLVLDDFAAGHRWIKDMNEESPLKYLYEVFDKRYDRCLPSLITTNLVTPEEFEIAIGPRNYERLLHCYFFYCDGVSLRRKART